MSLSDQPATSYPDDLTPAAMHRLHLWRALTDLSKAQEDGRLSTDQARLLEALADNLQQLAGHLTRLADLGKQYTQALDALLDTPPGVDGPPASITAHPYSGTPAPLPCQQPPTVPVQDGPSPRPPGDR